MLRPATEFGYPTALWTAHRVARLISDRFGFTYRPDCLREWLREDGCSPQRPERSATERDQPAIDWWTADSWPRLQ